MTSAGGWARLVKLGSSCEILLFSVAALHKSLTQDEIPLAGIWEKCLSRSLIQRTVWNEVGGNVVLEVDISPLSSCVQYLQKCSGRCNAKS